MVLEDQVEGDYLVVSLRDKRLDAVIAVSFREAMLERIEEGQRKLVLDLSNVGFLDSSGLGTLISLHKTRRDAAGNGCLAADSHGSGLQDIPDASSGAGGLSLLSRCRQRARRETRDRRCNPEAAGASNAAGGARCHRALDGARQALRR